MDHRVSLHALMVVRNLNTYTIQPEDVGRMLSVHDESWGCVLPTDVGKRLVIRSKVLQMENEEQKHRRETQQ